MVEAEFQTDLLGHGEFKPSQPFAGSVIPDICHRGSIFLFIHEEFLAWWHGRAVQPAAEKRRAVFERSEFARRRCR